ncbi:extracellular solute-binding protein [Paraburkholderia caledonica]|uniref:Multiple sugar transport system substrate-binding protein/putative spermidine/putrescine transport system substrate-binding protein n=1 Tax=Paraburkholderia caledonica TaxID=134536 RepID=A0AB73INK6_9BURK|nr:multiple sugar transport system substrate-binding protein/putative spermidine/putrescine transport system substrate-binding protein [Paraburkholderia caledonica]
MNSRNHVKVHRHLLGRLAAARLNRAVPIGAIVILMVITCQSSLPTPDRWRSVARASDATLPSPIRTLSRDRFYETVVPLAKAEGQLSLYSFPASFPPFWKSVVIPRFEAKYGIKVRFYDVRADIADQQLMSFRALGRTPSADVYFAPGSHVSLYRREGLAAPVDLANVLPEAATYPAAAFERLNPRGQSRFAPFHLNQTALAYNSGAIAPYDVPRDFDGLLAWAQAHPGQFAFTSPKNGGSGEGLLLAAVHQWTNPSCRQALESSWHDVDQAREWINTSHCLETAWEHLRVLDSVSVMTNGNADTQNLLANGAVMIGTVWEDMAYTFARQKLLPTTIRLAMPQPGMPGSADTLFMVAGAAHPAAALLLIDFALSRPVQQWKLDHLASRTGRLDLTGAGHAAQPASDFMLPAASADSWFGWPSASMMAALDDAFVHEVVEGR